MHPGKNHLKHYEHNYSFILFKATLGSWRQKETIVMINTCWTAYLDRHLSVY